MNDLNSIGAAGVSALEAATPKETGETASKWAYRINKTRGGYEVSWYNTHIEKGVNIAAILQYGHGTGTGGYVKGIDYINPAMRPVFSKFIDRIWKASS